MIKISSQTPCSTFFKAYRVGGALRSPSSHTTVRAMSHTAVPIKRLTTYRIDLLD